MRPRRGHRARRRPGGGDTESAASCGGGVYVGGASFAAEPGDLAPTYTPAGYRSVGAGSELAPSGGCDPVAVWVLLEGADGAQILLRRRLRPGGVPALDGSWRALPSGVEESHSRRSADGVVDLLWRAGDIVALLQADAASLDELVRIAESASPVPARSR